MSLFIITHLNRIMHHIQRKKVGVGAKVRNGKVYPGQDLG